MIIHCSVSWFLQLHIFHWYSLIKDLKNNRWLPRKIWIPHLLFVFFCFVLSISSFRLYHCIIIIIEEIVGFLIQYRSILPKFYSLFILYYLSRLSMSATVFNRSKVALWCHYWQVIVWSFSSLNPLYNLYFTFLFL